MNSLSVIFLVFSIRCHTSFKPQFLNHFIENNQTYISQSTRHEVVHLFFFFYHIDILGFPECNEDFQCGTNHIGGVMVRVLSMIVVDSGLEHRSSQTKDL